jgi:YtkA-like
MKPKVIVFTVIGTLIVAAGLVVAAFVIMPRVSQSPAFGPGMMRSGHAPGGLSAVSPDGQPLASGSNSELPDNTAAQKVGNLNVALALSPYPPVGFQKNDFDVTLTDENDQAITDAAITLDLTMPTMWMPPNTLAAQPVANGHYQASGRFTMRDQWRIQVIILRGGVKQSAFFVVWL